MDTEVLTARAAPEASARETPRTPVEAGSFTQKGLVVGTPLYMAPELVTVGTSTTSSADMYAFGVLACELLTGKRPFAKPQALAMFSGEVPEPIPVFATRVPELDPKLADLLTLCLALEPEARPSANELAALLQT